MVGMTRVSRRGAMRLTAGAGLAVATASVASEPPAYEVLAEGLGFPEGPVVMPDGSVFVVDLIGGRILRVWNGKSEVFSNIGGGPNGAQVGPDGALYICNSGGARPDNHSLADPTKPGRIERLDLDTGKVERLYEASKDAPLSAPNDLVFDADGGMWFTDYGKTLEECYARGGVYYARPDGSAIRPIVRDGTGFNGIGLSPDGKTLNFCRYFAGRLHSMEIVGPGKVTTVEGSDKPKVGYVGSGIGDCGFDGVAVTEAGNICIATPHTGGVTTLTPGGDVSFAPMPDSFVTNIAFGGDDMRDAYVTWSASGRLARMRWPEPGLKLNFPG